MSKRVRTSDRDLEVRQRVLRSDRRLLGQIEGQEAKKKVRRSGKYPE